MSRILTSISEFRQVWEEASARTFNLFFGAGASRDAPCNAPIWNDMPDGFLSALFDRMEREGWPISAGFGPDRATARSLSIRPEVFWRVVMEHGGTSTTFHSLQAVDTGLPNRNHHRIASLLESGRCGIAATTNFDEYVERCLGDRVRVEVPSHALQDDSLTGPLYLKLHGTISNSSSLAYTLEQYDHLRERAPALAQFLAARPLIVGGYSGFDTDVMPAFKSLIESVPLVVVVRHPGSPDTQPVLTLGVDSPKVCIVEAQFRDVLEFLCDGLPEPSACALGNKSSSPTAIYRDATNKMQAPYCPYILMSVFSTVGNWVLARRYGWLTHDACCDPRYRETLGESVFRDMHRTISYCLKLAGDDSGSQIMLGEAKSSLDEHGGSISEAMSNMWAQALAKNAPNFRASGYASAPEAGAGEKFSPSDVLTGLSSFPFRSSKNPRNRFLSGWQIGVARRREGNSEGAVAAFEDAIQVVLHEEQVVSHLERARFFLDYGSAVYEVATKKENSEDMGNAMQIFSISEHLAGGIADWPTHAKSHLMLAKGDLLQGAVEESGHHAKTAMESAAKTGDQGLLQRIEDFISFLDSLKQK